MQTNNSVFTHVLLTVGTNFIHKKLVELAIIDENQDAEETANEDDDNEFFKSKKRPSASEFELFLDSPTDEIAIYSRFPKLQKLFIELNTPLPASTACERLFSCAGLIFRPHRCSVKDDNFENSLLVKLNKKYY